MMLERIQKEKTEQRKQKGHAQIPLIPKFGGKS